MNFSTGCKETETANPLFGAVCGLLLQQGYFTYDAYLLPNRCAKKYKMEWKNLTSLPQKDVP